MLVIRKKWLVSYYVSCKKKKVSVINYKLCVYNEYHLVKS